MLNSTALHRWIFLIMIAIFAQYSLADSFGQSDLKSKTEAFRLSPALKNGTVSPPAQVRAPVKTPCNTACGTDMVCLKGALECLKTKR